MRFRILSEKEITRLDTKAERGDSKILPLPHLLLMFSGFVTVWRRLRIAELMTCAWLTMFVIRMYVEIWEKVSVLRLLIGRDLNYVLFLGTHLARSWPGLAGQHRRKHQHSNLFTRSRPNGLVRLQVGC